MALIKDSKRSPSSDHHQGVKAGSPPEEAGFDVAQAMVDESAPVEDGADNGGQDLTVKKNSNPFEDDDDEDEDEEKPPRYGQLLVVICILSLPFAAINFQNQTS